MENIKTPHMNNKKGDIAKTVIMPGDPLRAKYIAENFLENARLVNEVRGMLAYTGTYKGKEVTVFASGMGIPSMCIYAYELYKFHDVSTIIRIGTSGSVNPNISVKDIVIADKSYSATTFPKVYADDDINLIESTKEVSDHIESVAKTLNIKTNRGNIETTDVFGPYALVDTSNEIYPSDLNPLAVEMESFGLFYLAYKLNKKAACILTISDSIYEKTELSSEEREKSLNNMITLALESVE